MEESAYAGWLASYTDADKCISAFSEQGRFFRVNTLKMPVERFSALSTLECEPSPHCPAAFELRQRIELGKTWEYFLGWIYPQSLSSMLASLALSPGPQDTVLDAAASPGSKFSHMAMLMENRGVLVGNDVKEQKISALYATINRLNILNCVTTMRDGSRLGWKQRFSKILVDAPCTALGSGPEAWKRWDESHSMQISSLQMRMLFSAYDALKPGGEMVYSTCTYAKEENEEVVKNLLENATGASLVEIPVDVPHDCGLSEYGNEFRKCMRIYPQHARSEGFFIARIRKGA